MTRPTETYKLLITKGEFNRLAQTLAKGLTRLNLPTDTRRECKEVAGLMHGVWFEDAYLRAQRGRRVSFCFHSQALNPTFTSTVAKLWK